MTFYDGNATFTVMFSGSQYADILSLLRRHEAFSVKDVRRVLGLSEADREMPSELDGNQLRMLDYALRIADPAMPLSVQLLEHTHH